MTIKNTRFLLLIGALAFALPVSAEPLMQYYYEDEEIYEDAPEFIEEPGSIVPFAGGEASDKVPFAGEGVPGSAGRGSGNRSSSRSGIMQPGVIPKNPIAARTPTTRAAVQRTAPVMAHQPTATRSRTAIQRSGAVNNQPITPRARAARGTGQPTQRAIGTRSASGRTMTQPATNIPPANARAAVSAADAQRSASETQARASISGSPMPAVQVGGTSGTARNSVTRHSLYNSTSSSTDPNLAKQAQMRQDLENLKVEIELDNEKTELAAQVHDSCEIQFFGCMDNICAVVSDELGRCACSPNADVYKSNQESLKTALLELQDTVQNIQYIGLTAEEVASLFKQTEAEITLSSQPGWYEGKDGTDLKNMILSKYANIEALKIGETKTQTSGVLTGDSWGFGIDLNLFDADVVSSGLFGTAKNAFNDISGMTGGDIYKSAKNTCMSILTQCKNRKIDSDSSFVKTQLVDTDVIQARYDVEVGKACFEYKDYLIEQTNSLKTMNRNARMMLERARFQVAQSKNAFDLKGCVNEIDKCMQDDFVCGKNYKRCLDPTSQYISVDSKVVPGADLPAGQYILWGSSKDKVNYSALSGLAESSSNPKINKKNPMVAMLLERVGKIGESGNATSGYCAEPMKQCQRYSYTADTTDGKKFNEDNDVIKNYLYTALPKIMAEQNAFVANFQTQCTTDLKQCYQQQLNALNINSWGGQIPGSSLTWSNLSSALYACDSIGQACAYSVFSGEDNIRFGVDAPDDANAPCARSVKLNEEGTPTYTFATSKSALTCSKGMAMTLVRGLVQCSDNNYPDKFSTSSPTSVAPYLCK
ncbi:MAG: hypothetical protein LBB23_01335 [Rickettsiales bacterium]|jgi:hypothetical protein|nr:hypothetical protein [Rickettsiales bacterium]